MIGLAVGTRIWIVAGVTDMRRGFVGLSGMVQTTLQESPFSGQVYILRGRRGDLIKVLWFDGDGLCLFAKKLERGRFIWPQATNGTVFIETNRALLVLFLFYCLSRCPWERRSPDRRLSCLVSSGLSFSFSVALCVLRR